MCLVLVAMINVPLVGECGSGRAVAFTTDIGPHWCPEEFAEWDGYGFLWRNMVQWAAGGRP